MFTDMAGFTSITHSNERLSLELLEEQRSMVRSKLPKYQGKEVKTMGDGFLVVFASALEATRCAVDIQEGLESWNSSQPRERQLGVRIGIHVGDVIQEGDDIVGDGVNIASRIEPLAEAGGICVSRQVYDQIHNKFERPLVSLGIQRLKHIEEPVEVYKVIIKGGVVPSTSIPPERRRIAVLPLRSMSPDPKDEYFSEGMTEELISTLSRMAGFKVIARTSIMKYKETQKSVAEISGELGAGVLLEGSVRMAGNRLRINVQLVDPATEERIWSQEYDRELADVFAVQSDIAHQVAESLKSEILHISRAVDSGTHDPGAYTDYLRGRYFWNKRNEESLAKAIECFNESLKKDPGFPQAQTGLADAYAARALLEFLPPRDAYPAAKAAAKKALALDDGLSEAHTSLGLVLYQYEWDWNGAEDEFRRAIQLNPNYAPAHHFYADYLKAMGRFEEALNEIRRAQELDPLSLAINTGVGHVLYLSRKYDEAIDQYRKTVELDPSFIQTHLWFGRPYLQKGMYKEAIEELEKAVSLSARSTIALGMLGHAYASAGRIDEANSVLKELEQRSRERYVASYWIATIYNGFRNPERVFEWFTKAYDERSSWLVWINVEPRLDWVRSDSRFMSLLKKIGFS